MNIFELHFNPKSKEGIFFDSFVYEPENETEKRLGNLYIIGEINNALPNYDKFLNDLATVIKKEYYYSLQSSPEQSLKKALKKLNEYLSQKSKQGDVSWLGNLKLSVFTLIPKSSKENLDLNFTKVGDIKILLTRQEQIFDIGKNLEFQEIEPYPLKIFGNIVTGKLIENDKIIILTNEVSKIFETEKITEQIINASDESKIKKIIKDKEKIFKEISGICLLINLTSESLTKEALTFEKEAERIKFPKMKIPNLKIPAFKLQVAKLQGLAKTPKMKIPNLKIPAFKTPNLPIVKENLSLSFYKNNQKMRKNLMFILILTIVLVLGFFIFKKEEGIKTQEFQIKLENIKEKKLEAENFLIFKEEVKANLLFQEALEEIIPIIEMQEKIKPEDEILILKHSIKEQLQILNKIEIIENPEIYSGTFPKQDESLRLAGPASDWDSETNVACSYGSNLYVLNKETGEITKYAYSKNSKLGAPKLWLKSSEKTTQAKDITIDGNIWILTKNNTIDKYYIGKYEKTLTLNFYPKLENPNKIFTNLQIDELYILEPVKNRLIIIDKKGGIIKQYQSDKFNDLKDFSISEDGKTIFLLNESKIYKITL